MNLLGLYINGVSSFIEHDKKGKKIKYDVCTDLVTRKKFLSIWSTRSLIGGRYDIWKSDDGDILILKSEDQELEFHYNGGRYWLIKDLAHEQKIIDAFMEDHPDAVYVEFKDDCILATFDEYTVVYEIASTEEGFLFLETKRSLCEFDDELVDENTEGVILCSKTCYYQKLGKCKYFDWQVEQQCDELPACKEPFKYLETLEAEKKAS